MGDRVNSIRKSCAFCGNEFNPKAGRIESNNWCSKKCFYDSKRVFKICPTCGNEFYTNKHKNRKHCSAKCWRGDENYHPPNFVGDKHISGKGYIYIYAPDHPYVKTHPYKRIAEHRLVMEQKLGRLLHPWELVHHKDGNKTNNNPDNLELWISGHPNGTEVTQAYVEEIFSLREKISKLEALLPLDSLRTT